VRAWVAVCLLVGCGSTCPSTADIQVTLIPIAGVDVTAIAELRFTLTVGTGQPKSLVLQKGIGPRPTTVLFRPDPAPAAKYAVTITVEALDELGALVAIGSTGGDVSANGCNKLEARLTPLPMVDASMPPPDFSMLPSGSDLAGSDLATNNDLACAAMPDEDADGRGDACDLCPADYDPTPVDTDDDGLPDACDPDPSKTGNALIYFDPFNVDSGHWSGNWNVRNSERSIATMAQGRLLSGNGVDALPGNVRVQTYVTMPFVEGVGPSFESDVGIFLGNQTDSSSSTRGVLCVLHHVPPSTDTLDLDLISNGMITMTNAQPFVFSTGNLYRIRLSQRGGSYSCEALLMGLPAVSANLTTQAPAAPQFMVLRATNVEAHFSSVVAESTVP
jgi:hypothetical protein